MNQYFAKRPLKAISRALELAMTGSGFLFKLWRDEVTDTYVQNEEERAQELVELVTKLGPTFIKIAQALSIRGDVLPPAYVRALRVLQDRVAPFSSEEAFTILKEELGLQRVAQAFQELSPAPVAAASVGQVYKGRLRTGEEVAVKVQRPRILTTIATDLYLLRAASPYIARLELFRGVASVAGVIDEWGRGFVDELDYVKEGENGARFLAAMKACKLEAVTAPEVYTAYSSKRVLTTGWVDGESLGRGESEDTGRLCGVALNAYLAMMLQEGLLHCDPHPGNLLRTTDGRLCILDWGLTLQVSPSLQYALVDYLVHLSTQDAAAIPSDLIALGFVPPGREEEVRQVGVVKVLAEVQEQLASPEARGRLDIDKVTGALVGMTKEYGALFQIPSYFAYIIRAFTVLEGIGLSNDPRYSILQQSFPYLAKRLITDSAPRSQAALKSLLYGAEAAGGAGAQTLNVTRLVGLAEGLRSFTSSTAAPLANAEAGGGGGAGGEEAVSVMVGLLLSAEGNLVQETLLLELARLLEAVGRRAAAPLTQNAVAQAGSATLRRQEAALLRMGPAARVVFPGLLAATRAARRVEAYVSESAEDEAALDTLQQLLRLLAPLSRSFSSDPSALSANQVRSLLQKTLPKLQEVGPGASATLRRLVQLLRLRAEERLSAPERLRLQEALDAAAAAEGGAAAPPALAPTRGGSRTEARRAARTQSRAADAGAQAPGGSRRGV